MKQLIIKTPEYLRIAGSTDTSFLASKAIWNDVICNYLASKIASAESNWPFANNTSERASDIVWYSKTFNQIFDSVYSNTGSSEELNLQEHQDFFFWDYNRLKDLVLITCEAFTSYSLHPDKAFEVTSSLEKDQIETVVNLQKTVLTIIADVHAVNSKEVSDYLNKVDSQKRNKKQKDKERRMHSKLARLAKAGATKELV